MATIIGKAKIITSPSGVSVEIEWITDSGNLDRPTSGGWGVGYNMTLANRLAKAINAQKAFTDVSVKTDVDNKTYIAWTSKVHGRTMNRDLAKLGF